MQFALSVESIPICFLLSVDDYWNIIVLHRIRFSYLKTRLGNDTRLMFLISTFSSSLSLKFLRFLYDTTG